MTPAGRAGGVFATTVRRPVAILMVTVAALVFGLFSYRLLPVELMPDISYPSLTVRTEYPGAAPEEVEENVTRPIEEALGVVGGLIRLSSISRANFSDVTLEFTWDTPMSDAWQEVTERLDTVLLPDEADKPLILRYDPSLDPVLRFALATSEEGKLPPQKLKQLRTYAEQELKRKLEQIEGVAAIQVLGGLEEQILVALDEDALERTNLSILEVARRLSVENVNLAGGNIAEGDTEYLVRTVNEFTGLGEIEDLVIARRGERNIRLSDIGSVRSGWADRDVITRLDGREAVEVEIQKEADANIVGVAGRVRDAVYVTGRGQQSIEDELPEGWSLALVSDRSRFISASVDEVMNTAIIGGLLAIFVLFVFLRDFRITSVISVAIPVSVAATFAPMNMSDLSLNIMSLGGLALGIGMLVDSGIVVVESIARCREEGDEVAGAVVRGTSEVGTAVVASTLTTVAVFFPMLIVEGVAGEIFADLALTIVFALLASLLVSIFLVPALTNKVLRERTDDGTARVPLHRRIGDVLRHRSLGPLSEPGESAWLRLLALVLRAVPLLLIAWFALGRIPGGADLPRMATLSPLLIAGAIAGLAWLTNLFTRPGRATGAAGRLLAFLRALLIDPVMIVVESAWLALLWVGVILGVPTVLAVWILGFVIRVVSWPVLAAFDATFRGLQHLYPRIIRAALGARPVVLVIAAAAMALTVYGLTTLDTSLIPEVHQGEFTLETSLPVGTPLEGTLVSMIPLETSANEDGRIERALLKIGADPEGNSDPEEGEHSARLSVRLAPEPAAGLLDRLARLPKKIWYSVIYAGSGGAAALREEEVIADLRGQARDIPELESKISRPTLFSFRTPIEVEVEAYELGRLLDLGEQVRRELDALPFLTDVKSSARPGAPEVQILYDREALVRRGLDLLDVAELVRAKVQGEIASEYRQRERRIDIVARLQEKDRQTVAQLERLIVNPGSPVPIPLSAVADVEVSSGPADIRRVAQRRVALIQANVDGVGLGYASEQIRQRLSAMEWPSDAAWRIGGQVQEMERSTRSLWQALLLSMFFVYVVMAIQFESLLQPLLIMITVPLALVGVTLVLWAIEIPLSVVVFLGMIMLAGIVVNNAIVLVDYANRLRERGQTVDEAVVGAGEVRLRPILMTTATTVLGLLPMALGLGDGSEIRSPMAITVIVGLIASTLLTLVVLPTAYSALETGLASLRARREAAQASEETA